MYWEQILGFFTMWPSPLTTITLWAKAGVPLWQTIFYVVLLTSISLSFTYFGTGWLENWVIKRGLVKRTTIEKWRAWQRKRNNSFQMNGLSEEVNHRVKKWLIPKKDWKILACGFIPFIPLVPTIVIVVTKLLEIRNGFPFLILGNIVRNVIVCYFIYLGANFFL